MRTTQNTGPASKLFKGTYSEIIEKAAKGMNKKKKPKKK